MRVQKGGAPVWEYPYTALAKNSFAFICPEPVEIEFGGKVYKLFSPVTVSFQGLYFNIGDLSSNLNDYVLVPSLARSD